MFSPSFLQRGVRGVLFVLLISFTHIGNASAQSSCAAGQLTCGLGGWWKFTDGSGTTATDSSVNSNSGTLETNGTVLPAWGTSATATAGTLSFDGTDNYVQVVNSSTLEPTSVTVAAWIKFNSLISNTTCGGAPNNFQYIIFKQNSRSAYFEGYSLLLIGNQLNFTVTEVNGTQASVASQTTITPGVWYHVVATFSQPMVSLYVNGVLQGTATHNYPLDYGSLPVYMGRSGACGQPGSNGNFDAYFNGVLDDVRIYNRALLSSDVQQLYSSTQPEIVLTTDNTQYTAPATVKLTATASPASGASVTDVQFYSNNNGTNTEICDSNSQNPNTICQVGASPNNNTYTFAWNNVPWGNYSLTAVVTDSTTAQRTSSPVTILVSSAPQLTDSDCPASVPFSFTLSSAAQTSAGVYTNATTSGVLLRTLWSNVSYPAGTFNQTWCGTDDQGRLIPNGGATLEIAAASGSITGTPTIVTPGQGYMQGENLEIVQSGVCPPPTPNPNVYSCATAEVTSVDPSSGGITGINLTAGGNGYTSDTNSTSHSTNIIYSVRVLSNNVNYTWNGVIGNTSDSMSGSTVWHSDHGFFGMAFTGTTGYSTSQYQEQGSTTNKFSTLDVGGSKQALLGNQQGADTTNVATDGNYVYWDAADYKNLTNNFVYATCVSANSSGGNCSSGGQDSQVIFSAGASAPTTPGFTYASGIDQSGIDQGLFVTGLAVQQTQPGQTGYLFVAHAGAYDLDELNKSTGALVQSFTVTAPGGLATDANGNLWIISGTSVSKYDVNSDLRLPVGSNNTLSSPTLTLNAGSGATVGITTSGGAITGTPTIVAAGSGYSPGEELIIVQSGASGGHVTVTWVNGSGGITGLSLTAGGSGYRTTASGLSTLAILNSAGSGAAIHITGTSTNGSNTGTITGISTIPAAGGAGYVQGEELSIVQNGAFGGIVTVQSVDSNGAITGISLAAGGSDYTTAGSGAIVNITVSSGSITGITPINGENGSGYFNGEEVGIAGGSGGIATVTSVNQSGGINSISLTSGGSGYSSGTESVSAGLYLPLTTMAPPLGLAASPDNTTVLVAYGGSSQQVEAYSNSTGAALWTLGQAGGYANGPSVPNTVSDWSSTTGFPKFYFSDFDNVHTFLAFEPDGSFWVGDPGNDRALHFKSDQTYIEEIMYMHFLYNSAVDPIIATNSDGTKSGSVFGDFLEFKVNYTSPPSPLSPTNGSWTLVNNWAYNAVGNNTSSQYTNRIFPSLTTLSNNRRYAFLSDANTNQSALVELPPPCAGEINTDCGGGMRFTGYETPPGSVTFSINPDGSLRWTSQPAQAGGPYYVPTVGNSEVWYEMPLTGFDGSNNPIWGSAQVVVTSPVTTSLDPVTAGGYVTAQPMTSSNVAISFDEGLNSGYHLGGLQANGSTASPWLWRTAISIFPGYGGPYPSDGSYITGGVNYGGSLALALGRNIIWGYHGEGWMGGQTNEWAHVYDDGLMVGQFGTTSNPSLTINAPPMMAGNATVGSLVTDGTDDGNAYLYHNDESVHGGIHQWAITGLNTIAEQNVPVTLTPTTGGLLGQYYDDTDGTQLDNFNLKTSRVDVSVNLSANPTGTNLSNAAVSNYSVRWTGFVAPASSDTYTFYVTANSGVNLWVDNNLLISQWGNTSTNTFQGTITLNAGTIYPIRVEYYNTATSSLSLLWSSINQPSQVAIPPANLYPAAASNTSNGTNLMEGFSANAAPALQNNLYGWSMNPANQSSASNSAWRVLDGPLSYGTSRDVWGNFQYEGAYCKVARDLGNNTGGLTSWQISGNVGIGLSGNINNSQYEVGPQDWGMDTYLDVLDGNGLIIARFYLTNYGSFPSNGNDLAYANNAVIAQGNGYHSLAWGGLEPITISAAPNANGNVITIAYGQYPPVTTSVYDSNSIWQKPKTLRMYYAGGYGGVSGFMDDMQNMSFQATTPVSYTLIGPTSGAVNTASANFAVTPSAAYTGTITITPSGGGLSSPITLTFSNSAAAQTFSITPTLAGTVTLTPSNSGSLTDPNALTYTATAAYSLNVSYNGNGQVYGSVGSTVQSPYVINCGVNSGATTCSTTESGGTTITLSATPASGSTFSGWSGGTCSGTGNCTVTTNDTETASFATPQVGGVCGPAAQTYLYNTAVTPAFLTNFEATLCKAGTSNPYPVTFPALGSEVEWTCEGSGGGLNSSCKAQRDKEPLIKL